MPYILTQVLIQLPFLGAASGICFLLLYPISEINFIGVIALCLITPIAICIFSIYAYYNINEKFGFSREFSINYIKNILYSFLLVLNSIVIIVAILLITDCASININKLNAKGFLYSFGLSLMPAFIEEIIFRGVMQKKLMQFYGPYFGVIISSALFSLAHTFNPGYGLKSFIMISMLSAILFGWIYFKTNDLTICISLHFFWNFLMMSIVGGRVSGMNFDGIVNINPDLNGFIGGGAFGLESSIVTIIAVTISMVAFNRKFLKSELILKE